MRICLVGATHPSYNPRLLREADTLAEAGHEVRIVCPQADSMLARQDNELTHKREWKFQPLDLVRNGPSHRAWLIESARSRVFQKGFDAGLRTVGIASRGYVRGLKRMQKLAESEGADWFIAHAQAALPIAAAAAHRWNARLGFDCEDLLAELGSDHPDFVRMIEKEYLPKCDYVSAPSIAIATRLGELYAINVPVVLYNVFPLFLAEGMKPPIERRAAGPLRLHWFGQTVGGGRGIEEAIEALTLLDEEVELHLRGGLAEQYRSVLESLAQQNFAKLRLFFHPVINHEELIRTMDQFDIGLALERPINAGYSRTVTNKLFSYLLAGLAVVATDTLGQREIMEQIPNAGFLYPAGRPDLLAGGLRKWRPREDSLRDAQQAAWDAARNRWCWNIEKTKFLKLLQTATNSNRNGASQATA